jgi:hypothetical protein
MILPNKLVSFQNSLLPKTVLIIDELSAKPLSVNELYEKLRKKFEDLDQFILTLDVLYLLEKVRYSEEWEVLEYVENDTM